MKYRIIAGAIMMAGVASFPAYASELDDLKADMRRLQQRIEQLEQNQKKEVEKTTQSAEPVNTATAEAKPVLTGTMPGSIMIPGTDSSLRIYGNVRVDSTYDLASRNNDIRNNDWASAVFAQPLKTNSANKLRENQFYGTARASRLGVVTSTPTSLGEMEVKIEADFNAPNDYMGELGSNGTLFRLRQAYGRMGNLLVGQTWSNFIDLRSYPETVDFNPTGDVTLIRQLQLRYTIPLGPTTLALSIENPESLTQLPPYQDMTNSNRNDFNSAPDFTANWSWNAKDAHVSLRAATMEYRNDFRSKQGYAVGLSGSSKLGPGTLVSCIQGGEGIGRYMFNSITQGATDTGTALYLWKAAGMHLGYTMPWTSALRSNFILSRTVFGKNDAANTSQRSWSGYADEFVPNKRIDQAFVNLFWNVTKNVETGLEYGWGERETFGREYGVQQRINAMIQYNLP